MPLRALQLCWTHPVSCIAWVLTSRRPLDCNDGEQSYWQVSDSFCCGLKWVNKCPCGACGCAGPTPWAALLSHARVCAPLTASTFVHLIKGVKGPVSVALKLLKTT